MNNNKSVSKTRVLLLQLLVLILIQVLVYVTVNQILKQQRVFDPTYPTSPPPVQKVTVPKATMRIEDVWIVTDSSYEHEILDYFLFTALQPLNKAYTENSTDNLSSSLVMRARSSRKTYFDTLYGYTSLGVHQFICKPPCSLFQVIENETKFEKCIFLIPSTCYECKLTPHFINLSGSPGTRFRAMIKHMEEFNEVCLIFLNDPVPFHLALESMTLSESFRGIHMMNSSKTIPHQVIEAEVIAKNYQTLYLNTTIAVLCYDFNSTLISSELHPTLFSSKWYSFNKPSMSSEKKIPIGITLFYPQPLIVNHDKWVNISNVESFDEFEAAIPVEFALWYDASMIFLKSNIRYGGDPPISFVKEVAKHYKGLTGNCTISEDGYRKHIEYEMVTVPP